MLALYLTVLLVLALVQLALRWRVRSLERRYVKLAAAADTLLHSDRPRGGTNARADPLAAARRQYELAQAALKRDRVEVRYTSWQTFAEKFAALRGRLSGYRGKVVPYVGGMLDVVGVVLVLDRAGLSLDQVRTMLGLGGF